MSKWFSSRTPKYVTTNDAIVGDDTETRSEDSLVIIDEPAHSESIPFATSSGNDMPSPQKTASHTPCVTQASSTDTVGSEPASNRNFMAMTDPSPEAIANAQNQILRNYSALQEERIEAHQRTLQMLVSEHAKERLADCDEYDRQLEAQARVHREETSSLAQKHFAVEDTLRRQLQDGDRDHKAEVKDHQRTQEAETQDRKQKHDAQIEELGREHQAEIERLSQQNEATLRSRESKHNGDIESLKQDHEKSVESLLEDHEAQIRAFTQEQAALKHKHGLEIGKLKSEHKARVRTQAEDFSNNAKETIHMHQAEITSIKVKHTSELDREKRERGSRETTIMQKTEVINLLHAENETLKEQLAEAKNIASKYKQEQDTGRWSFRSYAGNSSPSSIPVLRTPTAPGPPSALPRKTHPSNQANQQYGRHIPPAVPTLEDHRRYHRDGNVAGCDWCPGESRRRFFG